jgi:hypothetical protein
LIAAVLLAAAAVHGSVIDQTWSCPVFQEGQAHVVGFDGTVDTPRAAANMQFFPTPIAYDEPAVLPGVDVQTKPASVTWDPRHRCTRVHVALALGPHGLPKESVVTTTWIGATRAVCHSATQIVFRARVTLQRGTPARAQVIAVDAGSRKPLGYLDWTPTRITSWFDPKCEAAP